MNNDSKQIGASAPGKLMLSGSHAVVFGRPAIVTAVNQRLTVFVRENGDDVFHLTAPELGLIAYAKTIATLGKKELPKAVRFIEILYKNFLIDHPQKRGIVVTTKSDFSATFGFGSSSAVTVAFARALIELYDLQLSKKELFQMCYDTVLEVQGVGSGFDIASAIWGGTIQYSKVNTSVETITVKNKLPILVCYTGIKADTPTLVRMVEARFEKNKEKYNHIFDEIGAISVEIRKYIEDGNVSKIGALFAHQQNQMEKLGVSSTRINTLLSVAQEAGAYGATLSGAGGGDCILVAVDENISDQVAIALENRGGKVLSVDLNAAGVRLENDI